MLSKLNYSAWLFSNKVFMKFSVFCGSANFEFESLYKIL